MYQIMNKRLIRQLSVSVKFAKYSTQPAVKSEETYEKKLKEFEEISKITPKFRTKLPQKPPFVKNLMVGVFDNDILTYPQLTKEELSELTANLEPIKNFLQSPDIKECTSFTKEFREKLAQLQLIGLQVSQLNGGRELTVTESFRVLEEIAKVKLGARIIFNESVLVQALNKFGSDSLKGAYIQKLLRGELSTAFCVLEPTQKDDFNRTGVLGDDLKNWLLNGQKKMVINGSTADLFLVIAQTDTEITNAGKKPKLTAFIIERDAGGISSKKQETTLGEHLEVSNIVFENVTVSPDNILGEVQCGDKVLSSIYPEYRLAVAPICVNILRNLIKSSTEYFLNYPVDEYRIYETDAIKTKITESVIALYAVESVIYLTTGLMDTYENQDVEMESTISKIFSSQQAVLATSSCIDLIGAESINKNHWASLLHNEALGHAVLNDNNDSLKMALALFGLQYAGVKLNDLVKKLRNPLYYASFIFKRMWTNSRQVEDNPKLNLNLHFFVHPSLILSAKELEYCVLRLRFATETLLSRHGQEVVNQHNDLRRLAECVIDIYAMTACLGRASRAYCIGLQHAEAETFLANSFCVKAKQRVQRRVLQIHHSLALTIDEDSRRIADTLFRFKDYFPVHPLSRNF